MIIAIKIHNGSLVEVFDTQKDQINKVILTTIIDNQKQADAEIFADHKKIRTVTFTQLPKARAGRIQLPLTFKINENKEFILEQTTDQKSINTFKLGDLKNKILSPKIRSYLWVTIISLIILSLLLLYFKRQPFSKSLPASKARVQSQARQLSQPDQSGVSRAEKEDVKDKEEKKAEKTDQTAALSKIEMVVKKNTPFYFEKNSIRILPEEEAKLMRVIKSLKQYPGLTIVLHGHTAHTDKEAEELWLSRQRALLIKEEISSAIPGLGSRIQIKGHGSHQPLIQDPATQEQMQKNRRVEIEILVNHKD